MVSSTKHASQLNNSLNKILSVAAHSPSSHNTQPWLVSTQKNTLIIGYDEQRKLTVGDPQSRELFISLGCFIESVCQTASALSYKTSVTTGGFSPNKVAKISFSSQNKKTTDTNNVINLIKSRRSDRRFFEKKHIPNEELDSLRKLTQGSASVLIFDDVHSIKFLADMTKESTLEIMSKKEFREELAMWVRNNWTKKHDGMPGYTQGMPGPISLIAKFVIRKNKKVANDQAKKDSKRVLHSSALALIVVRGESPSRWLEAGRLYQRLCINALSRTIKTSAVSAAVISPKTSKKIIQKLRIKGTPVALIRLGYTKNSVKAAPRLSPNHFAAEAIS